MGHGQGLEPLTILAMNQHVRHWDVLWRRCGITWTYQHKVLREPTCSGTTPVPTPSSRSSWSNILNLTGVEVPGPTIYGKDQ
jgi:hypothetical protein